MQGGRIYVWFLKQFFSYQKANTTPFAHLFLKLWSVKKE